MSASLHDVVILGSGPAGLTAAIYTARASLEPLVLEGEPSSTGDQPGGQLMLTTEVENFPGFPEGIMGPELMMNFKAQAERFGAKMETVKASRVDFSERPFKIWVGDPEAAEPTYLARTVIVSTGAEALMLGLPKETRADRPRRVDVCHLRRLLLPRPRHRRHRRRRFGHRGGHVPHQVREVGHDRAPARRAPGLEDHAGPGVRQPEDQLPVGFPCRGAQRRHEARRPRRREHQDRRAVRPRGHRHVRGHRPPAQHLDLQGPARHEGQRLPRSPSTRRPAPTSRACSPAATCRTTTTARPSPPPDRAAPRPSTPNIFSRSTAWRSSTPTGARRNDRASPTVTPRSPRPHPTPPHPLRPHPQLLSRKRGLTSRFATRVGWP